MSGDDSSGRDEPLPAVPTAESGNRRYNEVAPRPPVEGPIDLGDVIPGEGDFEIDVGFGRGHSMWRRASVAPEGRLLGIEIKTKWAYKVEERRLKQGLTGLRAWAGDAREILERCGPDGYVKRVYVHFPDPWWKRRHQHRLVVADRFLDAVARLLRNDGEIYVQTDVKDRGDEYAQRIGEHPAFRPPVWLDSNVYGAISGREAKAIDDGLPVYRMVARRVPRKLSERPEHE